MKNLDTTPFTIVIDYMGRWHVDAFFVLCIFIIFIIGKNYLKRIGLIAGVLWTYAIISALYLVEFPTVPFGDYNKVFKSSAGEVLVELILIPIALLEMRLKRTRVQFFFILLSIWTIVSIWMEWNGPLIAASFNAALIAVCVPFLPRWLQIASVITILTRHAGTAQMILGAEVLAYAIKDRFWRKLLAPAAFVLSAIILWNVNPNAPFWMGNGRWDMWIRMLSLWYQNWQSILFGFGPGSFIWISLIRDKFQPPAFFHMHSDFLQIMFELGLVGCGLALALMHSLIKKVWDQTALLASLFGIVAFSLTYHPTRFIWSAIVVMLIVKEALVDDERFE